MPSTTHVGLDYSQVIPAMVCLAEQLTTRLRVEDGGWYVWGEEVSQNGNDERIFHA